MSISKVNHQGTTFNATSCNVDTSGLSLGDLCFVYISIPSTATITPSSGWTAALSISSTDFTFYKTMRAGGDISATNTFSWTGTRRGAVFGLGIRGVDENTPSTYQGAINGNTHAAQVTWPTINNVKSAAILIGFVASWDSSVNQFSTTSPLPAGYTDSGVGDLSFGIGLVVDASLFYALNVGGTVTPPATTPGGGTAGDYGYNAGCFALRKYDAQQVA